MKEPALTLFLPRESRKLSGGNLYNREIVEALRRRVPVETPDIASLGAALDRGAPGVYLLDSLDLEAALTLERRAPGQRFGLLMHHLPSLEPGLSDSDPARDLERRALERFDFWIATSELSRELLIERGLAPQRVFRVAPALRPVERGDRELGVKLRALWVGNLIPRKALLPWLTELSGLVRAADDFELTVCGRHDAEPEYAEACRRAAARLGERVTFQGVVAPEEMPALYRASSLFVSSSEMETFGMALQEARGFGVPILALDGGNAREHVVAGETGLLVPSHRESCTALLGFARDLESLRPLFEGAARVPVNRRSWDDAAEELLSALAAL